MADHTETQAPPVVLRAVDAAERRDTDSFLSCFARHGAVDDWGRRFTGSEEIRRWSDAEFIGKNVTLSNRRYEARGDTTVLTCEVGGDGFNGPSTFTFAVEGERIALMKITA